MAVHEPSIQFFRGPTGHRVAYAEHGQGPALVCPAWWVSHLERDYEQPGFQRLFGSLAEHFTVVRYDRPGAGLSDREREQVTAEDELRTLAALIDHLALSRVSLFALACGGPPALHLAASQPERVERVVLFGSYLRGAEVGDADVQQAVQQLVRAHWGMGSTLIANLFDPGIDPEARTAFGAQQRASASKHMAAELLRLTFEQEAAHVAERVRAPCLVLHRVDDRTIPFAAGRELAASLPNARLQSLAGSAHVPWLGDVEAVLSAVLSFLGVEEPPAARQTEAPSARSLVRQGDVWTLTFDGRRVHLKDARGLADLAQLLQNPGREMHAVGLWSGGAAAPETAATDAPLIDGAALQAYRQRLGELNAAIEEAGDEAVDERGAARVDGLRAQRDALARELRAAVGLGGRKRALDPQAERARKAVTARIRASLQKIAEAHPAAGLHLNQHVITGVFCVYQAPDEEPWLVR